MPTWDAQRMLWYCGIHNRYAESGSKLCEKCIAEQPPPPPFSWRQEGIRLAKRAAHLPLFILGLIWALFVAYVILVGFLGFFR